MNPKPEIEDRKSSPPFRIEIGLKRGVRDARGHGVKAKAGKALQLPLQSVQTRTVYKIDAQMNRSELNAVRHAFTDPVIEISALNRLRPPRFDWMIEVGFKPGVTDNVGRTARAALGDVLGRKLEPGEDVYTAIQYFVRGAIKERGQRSEIRGQKERNGETGKRGNAPFISTPVKTEGEILKRGILRRPDFSLRSK